MTGPSTYLVDSNVLVCAWDFGQALKQPIAARVIQTLFLAGRSATSTQVPGETFNALTRRIRLPLPVSEARDRIGDIILSTEVRPLTVETVREAVRGSITHQMSYWDALIWATAKLAGIGLVLTEDIQSSGAIEGVSFVNPFDPAFDMARL